jgi:DNA primase
MVQMSVEALNELWGSTAVFRNGPLSGPASTSRYKNDDSRSPFDGRYGAKSSQSRSASRGRVLPLTRPDLAVRLLLSNMTEWEGLSHEQHAMLCDLPGEHGRLFGWLDNQLHEHGAQPWAALLEGLRQQPFEPLAVRLMTAPEGGPIGDPEGNQTADAARELRSVLDFMLDDRLKAQQSEAIAVVGTDPQALERYKALESRRLILRARLKSNPDNA